MTLKNTAFNFSDDATLTFNCNKCLKVNTFYFKFYQSFNPKQLTYINKDANF